MGYNVSTTEINATIPSENLAEATRRLKALNHKPGVEKRGGRFPGNGAPQDKWFSWMEWNYDEVYDTAQEILEALGFDTYSDGSGGLSIDHYDSKTGQEELFIFEIADLMNEDWYIEWRGEDGALFKWSNSGEQHGTVVYE